MAGVIGDVLRRLVAARACLAGELDASERECPLGRVVGEYDHLSGRTRGVPPVRLNLVEVNRETISTRGDAEGALEVLLQSPWPLEHSTQGEDRCPVSPTGNVTQGGPLRVRAAPPGPTEPRRRGSP